MCSCSSAGIHPPAPRRVRLEHFSQFLENSLSSFTAGVHSAKIQLREPALYGQKNPWEKRSKTSHQAPPTPFDHRVPKFSLSSNLNVFSKAWKVRQKRVFQLLKWKCLWRKECLFWLLLLKAGDDNSFFDYTAVYDCFTRLLRAWVVLWKFLQLLF